MRRIEVKHCRCGVRDGRTVTAIATADYRKLLRVVKAAEKWMICGNDWQAVQLTIDALNAKPRKQP